MRKNSVAIFGLGESARGVKIDRDECLVWSLPWDQEFKHGADALFDLHPLELSIKVYGIEYLQYLQRCGKTVFMQEKHCSIFYSERYPLEDVTFNLGRRYLGSTPAYMIAYAIWKEIPHIQLYGVDLKDSIYDHQRPNLEWLIGLGEGRGHTFYIAPGGNLFKYTGVDRLGTLKVRYPDIYGFNPEIVEDADVS